MPHMVVPLGGKAEVREIKGRFYGVGVGKEWTMENGNQRKVK